MIVQDQKKFHYHDSRNLTLFDLHRSSVQQVIVPSVPIVICVPCWCPMLVANRHALVWLVTSIARV